MDKNMIRLGLVGLADDLMYDIADSISRSEMAELAFIVDTNDTKGRETAAKYGVDYEVNLSQAMKNCEADGICIGSELEARKKEVFSAMKFNKPILCLNPIAETVEGVNEIMNSVKDNGIKFFAPFNLRYNERFNQVRGQMISEGRKLGSLHCTYRKTKKNGNVLTDIGIHVLDFIRWFTRLEVDQVYLEVGGETGTIDETKNALMMMYLNSGAFASAEISYSFEEEIYINATYDDLFLQMKPLKQSVILTEPGKTKNYLWRIHPSEYIVEELIKYIKYDEKPSTTIEDIYNASTLMAYAEESAGKSPVKKTD